MSSISILIGSLHKIAADNVNVINVYCVCILKQYIVIIEFVC